jgi:peptidylprolyl isomerase
VPTQRDYYSILQVNPAATQEAIEAAYRRLSRLYDPEISQKRKAAERKQELDEAYDVLSDRKRRSDYDRLRARGWRPGQPQADDGVASGILAWLGNPYVFSGLVGSGVLIILLAIILISVLGGGGGGEVVANPSGTAASSGAPTPTLPAQSPTTAPAAPPEITGQAVTTSTGLQYIDIQEGTGASPLTGDRVVVNYTGWLQDGGAKFDSSLERAEPFSFALGTGGVIPGWDEGVATMKVGGKRRLIIPPELGYGASGQGSIPANATLIFDIDLLDIFAASTPAPTAAATP